MSNIITLIALAIIIMYTFIKRSALKGAVLKVNSTEAAIDAKLKERFKTFTDLIEVMDKYMDTEKSSFGEVVMLEEKAQKARDEGDIRSRIGDEDKISRHVEGIGFAFEQHEQLKADQKAQELFSTLVTQEGELAQLKLACNKYIDDYNHSKNSLFGSMVAFMFNKSLNHRFEAWHVNADAIGGADKYQVEL